MILTGAGKAFCAGMDLEELKTLTGKSHAENVADSRKMAQIFRRLYEFPKPTIAAVNGAAIAGGTGLATMCDFTLAVPEAKFGYTEVRIGFVPAIVSSILVWQVGHKIARDLCSREEFSTRPKDTAWGWSTKSVRRRSIDQPRKRTGDTAYGKQPDFTAANQEVDQRIYIRRNWMRRSSRRSRRMPPSGKLRISAKA